MMFVDASAIVAVIAREDGWMSLSEKIDGSADPIVSPLVLWEAVTALSREAAVSVEAAEAMVAGFVAQSGARIVEIDEVIGKLAIAAFRRFGKGRHPARLNFGDCFAYACARHLGVPLLFNGNDFRLTDIEMA